MSGKVYGVQFQGAATYYLVAVHGPRSYSMALPSTQVNLVQRPTRREVLEKLSALPDEELLNLSTTIEQKLQTKGTTNDQEASTTEAEVGTSAVDGSVSSPTRSA